MVEELLEDLASVLKVRFPLPKIARKELSQLDTGS